MPTCKFCGKEVQSKEFWCGPKKLNLCYCNFNCYWAAMQRDYPELFKHPDSIEKKPQPPVEQDCKKCICYQCPRKPECNYGGWNLEDWCSRANQHYCGDCFQAECDEAAQMKLF